MIAEMILHAHHSLVLAGNPVPNPAPIPIPGMQVPMNTIIGWGKWLADAIAVLGLGACGVMMMAGRRNRHSFAADGAAGIPWVLGGAILVTIGSGIIGVFL
jgi:hypothetical protein